MLKEIASTPVSDINIREPVRVAPDTPLIDVVTRMREQRRGAAIVEDGGKVTGIFTERDLMLRVDHTKGKAWHQQPVSEFMTRDVVMIAASDPLSEALKKMKQGLFRH